MRQLAKLVTLQMLRAYKWAISPLFPPSCRYVPTCSEYCMEAVERYGVVRGALMGCARILRCHPFARGGYDPVVRDSEGHSFRGCGKSDSSTRVLPQRVNSPRKNRQEQQEQSSGARASIDFARPTAPIELVPFPVTRESAFFQRPVKAWLTLHNLRRGLEPRPFKSVGTET